MIFVLVLQYYFNQFITNKTSLALRLFIEVPVPNQESEQSCICVGGIDFHI
jgi:hypothetical protein